MFWKEKKNYLASKIMLLDCQGLLSRLNFRSQSWSSVCVPQRCTNVQQCSPCLLLAHGGVNPFSNSESDPFIYIISLPLVFSCNSSMCTLWKCKSCLFADFVFLFFRPAIAAVKGQPVINAMCSLAIANVSQRLVDRVVISAPWASETFQTVWPVTVTWEEHWWTLVMRNRVFAAVQRKLVPALARYGPLMLHFLPLS